MSAANIQVHFRLDFFMEANNMNPDQTASKVHIVYNIIIKQITFVVSAMCP